MTKTEIAREALCLPEQDRVELAEALWASLNLENADEDPNLPEWQRDLLDRRLKASAGETGETWDEVRAAIWPEAR